MHDLPEAVDGMRRRPRRTAKRSTTADVLEAMLNRPQWDTDTCPDCRADVSVTKHGGVYVLTVAHDPTCPMLAARRRGDR